MKEPIVVHGEQFHLDQEGEKVFITHPQWSLMGMGRDYAEALTDLMEMADEMGRLLAEDDNGGLSPQARRCRDFCKKIRKSHLRLEK